MDAHKEVAIETPASEEAVSPEIHLNGVEGFKHIVENLKIKLSPLVSEGVLSQPVANKILDEFTYNAFQQTVKVEYR